MRKFVGQVRIRLISQLIKGILIALQKLLKYFNGTDISAFVIPRSLVSPKNVHLNLNESQSVIGYLGSSLQYCH